MLPHLSKLARRILAIQASSAKSERVFSSGGLTVTNNRTQLNEERVEDLVYLALTLPILKDFENDLDTNGNTVAKKLRLDSDVELFPLTPIAKFEETESEAEKTF